MIDMREVCGKSVSPFSMSFVLCTKVRSTIFYTSLFLPHKLFLKTVLFHRLMKTLSVTCTCCHKPIKFASFTHSFFTQPLFLILRR